MTAREKIEVLIDELMDILDADSGQIESTLEHLDRLRSAVIKRDEESLKSLLDQVGRESDRYRIIEMKRQQIRKYIADLAGCDVETMNLSKICSLVDGQKAVAIAERQRNLHEMVEKLNVEHTCTTLLLRECSRLNKALLKGIVGGGDEVVTYTARGDEKWELGNTMVNMRM